jgi:hypothetical protein
VNLVICFNFTSNSKLTAIASHLYRLRRRAQLAEDAGEEAGGQGERPGDMPAARIAAVEDHVDEVDLHDIRLGTTLGLAAMATHTGVDYSTQPRGFHGGAPKDIDDIEVILESLDSHGDAIADSIHPQSVLNRLFD